ncbi:Altered inheritance of mitochondria protein 41, mitochondrial [Psilocybe cubensis]|uniref:Altered inheritance of mitochondria protein 41 n=2 Tax=Psilocybe cubensis TaxID=181762 RepID=A0A8H8CN91_PSICU|nr:Altered inheritance of mitochondria protein 41, mitochondrial [Psilocybe cubensis]KAH9485280.1 Altered inheritance of mitochondria protein 41, mitochondrial [Psilocybe cubensis]
MLFIRTQLNFTRQTFCRQCSKLSILDPRPNLRNEIKIAMKNRDSKTSTTLRSVMSEIDSAEKTSKAGLSSSDVIGIIRTAIQRRNDAAKMFTAANRPDLAEKEQNEVKMISKFVPPLMSVSEIDNLISDILGNLKDNNEPHKALPTIFKEFYSKVDKSSVDRNLVKERAQELSSKRV